MLLLSPRDATSAVVDIQDAEGRCCFCYLEMLLLLLLIFKMRKRCKEMRPLRHQLHSTCIIHNNAPRVLIKKSELRLLTTLIREEAPPLTSHRPIAPSRPSELMLSLRGRSLRVHWTRRVEIPGHCHHVRGLSTAPDVKPPFTKVMVGIYIL